MTRYTSATDSDRREMLAAIGVGSIEELFADSIPEGVRLGRAIDLPEGRSEQEVLDELAALAARVRPTRRALRFFDQLEWDEPGAASGDPRALC